MQKYGISKAFWLLQRVYVWVSEGDAACLNRPMNPAGVKKSEKRMPWAVLESYKTPYWVTEVGQERVKVH